MYKLRSHNKIEVKLELKFQFVSHWAFEKVFLAAWVVAHGFNAQCMFAYISEKHSL